MLWRCLVISPLTTEGPGMQNLLWMQNPELAGGAAQTAGRLRAHAAGHGRLAHQSPWQGVSRLAQALLGGYEARKGMRRLRTPPRSAGRWRRN